MKAQICGGRMRRVIADPAVLNLGDYSQDNSKSAPCCRKQNIPYLKPAALTYPTVILSTAYINPYPMRAGRDGDILHIHCVIPDEEIVHVQTPFVHEIDSTKFVIDHAQVPQIKSGSLLDLQLLYDMVLPQCSTHFLRDDQKIVEDTNRELILETVTMDLVEHKHSKEPMPAMAPHLRTSMYPSRVPSQLEALLAMIERKFIRFDVREI